VDEVALIQDHSKPLCACIDRTFVKSVAPACRGIFSGEASVLLRPLLLAFLEPALSGELLLLLLGLAPIAR
jgi:hypothetical protein